MSNFPTLFSTDSAKAAKASGYGYLNAIQYIAPSDFGGFGDLCVNASDDCERKFLGWFSGQAAMVADIETGTNPVRESRKRKAQLFMTRRVEYMNRLARDIVRLDRKAKREGLKLAIRLNGSSDIAFERISFKLDSATAKAIRLPEYTGRVMTLLPLFPALQFIDYTKSPNRLGKAPANLYFTLSYQTLSIWRLG